ncbi:N-acetyltransferase [Pontibacter sp. JH31]|uniref:N-acetyltransferase n=1 Tax=Pontibacter aquaedesilientis TaxID=2766980 RepID=A0ABR7XCX4_9BACT|nr:N-acetyltransferase [Pontibacter aquaedesilientis]MBD1396141.1 N-acetyltransferase [Pontibacter aquaedesilientis]
MKTGIGTLVSKAKKGVNLLLKGHAMTLWNTLRKRIYSSKQSVGLRRDMSKPFASPKANIDIQVRPLEEQDTKFLLCTEGLTEKEVKIVEVQRNLVNSDLKRCYVAVTEDGTPCYMQWVLKPQDNKKIKRYFGNIFPDLKQNEALLEGAFMHHAFRGKRVMPEAMCQIADQAYQNGARYVITFVEVHNIPSLKGCKNCGFSPYILRKETWILFRRYVSFEALPEEKFVGHAVALAS